MLLVGGTHEEGLVMTQQLLRHLVDSVVKVAEDARQEELRYKIEAAVTQKLSNQFTRHLAETQAALEKKFQKQINYK